MCLHPKLIKNKRYTNTKKNGGVKPAIFDNRVLAVPIGCGECSECRRKKAREWQVRLSEDIKKHKNGQFVTLTFNNESIGQLMEEPKIKHLRGYDKDNAIAKLAVRRYNERHRKKHKKAIRHWLITELGHNGTENIHLHGILWTNQTKDEIEKIWQYGTIWVGTYVNEATINYTIKYVTKIDKDHKYYKSKILTSAGIGANYIETFNATTNKYKQENTKEYYTTRSGHRISLPIYYRNKIYTDDEKEKLWIEKLNKNERWINGVKIDISKEQETYYTLLNEAQIKDKRIGYGNGITEWNRKKYEEERRDLLNEKRKNNEQKITEMEKYANEIIQWEQIMNAE
jgi:hypothetical protein